VLRPDAVGDDAVHGVAPDVLVPDRARAPLIVSDIHVHEMGLSHDLDGRAHWGADRSGQAERLLANGRASPPRAMATILEDHGAIQITSIAHSSAFLPTYVSSMAALDSSIWQAAHR
jgi:hypothetical protein